MKIVLSENLSRHFAELDFSASPNVDRLLSLVSRYHEQRDDSWAQLRCAAKLVADEFVMVKPDYDALAAKTGGGSGTLWLQNALSVENKAVAPEPKLLADAQRLEQFLTQRMELAARTSGAQSAKSSAATEVAAVGEFVAAVMDSLRQPNVSVFLSPDPVYNRAYLEITKNITADNILATLATAGIKVMMPRVLVDTGTDSDINHYVEDAVIAEVRSKLEPERQAYIACLRGVIKDCYEGLKSGLYTDVFDYADKATNQELMVQVRGFENAMKGSDKKLLNRIKVGTIEGLPSIAAALLDPTKSVVAQTGIEILKVLSSSFASNSTYRDAVGQFPMASYVYKLRTYN